MTDRRWGGPLGRAAAVAVCGVAVLVAVALLPPVAILDREYETSGDVHHYESIAGRLTAGGIPYRDFDLEYPPLALVPIGLPALGDSYQRSFRLLMLLVASIGVVLAAMLVTQTGGGRARLLVCCVGIGLAPLALPVVFFDRYDAWPAILLLAGAVALTAERRVLSTALLAAGSLAKVFPGVAMPAVALADGADRRTRTRAIAAFAGILGSVLLLFVLVGTSGAAQAASTLVRRPLHIESLGGSVLLSLHQLGLYDPTVYVSFGGSQDLAGAFARAVALLQGALTAVLLFATWVLYARGPRTIARGLGATAASVVVLVAFGKVLSPQFLIWIVFAVPLVTRRALMPAAVLTGAALGLTRAYYPYRYEELILLGDVAWVTLLRNVVLCVLALYLIASLRRPQCGSALSAAPAPGEEARAGDRA